MKHAINAAPVTATSPISMLLLPEDATFPVGTRPKLVAVIKNVSRSPLAICTYMLKHRLSNAVAARTPTSEWMAIAFRPTEFAPASPADIRTLEPSEQLTEELAIEATDLWFIRTNSQPKRVTEKDVLRAFPRGTYTFVTTFSPWAVVYVGEAGVHDRKTSMKRLPDHLELAGVDKTKVFNGTIQAESRISFR